MVAWGLERLGALDRWNIFRDRWFVSDARGALVLLALWPPALLFPAAEPLGLGQVWLRLASWLTQALQDTPFALWVPGPDGQLQAMLPGTELLCVMLGALIPCLLGFTVIRHVPRRWIFALAVLAAGACTTGLSAALSYGPEHTWAWISLPVRYGLLAACLVAVPLSFFPRRSCAALALLAICLHLALLNQAPLNAYFAQTLQTWEQGRFIRFHGLAQWLGWLWPFLTLGYLLVRISSSATKN